VVNLIGVLDQPEKVDGSMFMRSISTIRRITVGSRADLEALSKALAAHETRPVIDSIHSFDQVREAYRQFESRRFFGKIVIRIA
jgi:D-arabinose 1-dehydrogenase-like Zn-dependent alcohol dehydrogenase